MDHPTRREFLGATLAALPIGGALACRSTETRTPVAAGRPVETASLFEISLAQWSLNGALFSMQLDNLDFAAAARSDYDIDAVEYVNQFFRDKADDEAYISRMKQRAHDAGVRSLLVMVDGEGYLGDPEGSRRSQAVENHRKWLTAAKALSCHSIRVNAQSAGTFEEQQKLAADGLARLTEFGAALDLGVIVENHGGLSSNGEWLAGVIRMVDMPNCGTLPDFGNFNLGGGKRYDRYKGVAELMPFAKAVSAKSHDFDENGEETHTDFARMMRIVTAAGYHGHVGIEYEGSSLSEPEGIRATKRLLERVRTQLSRGA